MRESITLNSKKYKLARDTLLPSGARRWAVSGRPSQSSDPSIDQFADWEVSGANLFSFETEDGYLGVDYTTGVDTRWKDLAILAPATTTVDCSTGDTLTPASPVALELTKTLNASARYLYVIRGREPKKVKLSSWTAYDSGFNLGAAGTSCIYTRNNAGTEELTIGMADTITVIVSAVGTEGAADTQSNNNESKKATFLGVAPDRIVAMYGTAVHGNVLSGSVTMDASVWTAVATLDGYNLTPTGFALDGDRWVLGYDQGPFLLDVTNSDFFPIFPDQPRSSTNCAGMTTWAPQGVIIPMARGLRYQKNGSGESLGPERFLSNTSPVSGRCTALAGTDHWLYAIFYDAVNDDSYLCAGTTRRPGDPHPYPMSWFVLKKFTDTKSNVLKFISTGDGALTNDHLVGGHSVTATPTGDIFYSILGRYYFEPNDSNYRFQTAGTEYLTELRRDPGIIKDLMAVELTSAACGASDTLTLGFVVDGAAAQTLTGTTTYSSGATLNGVVDTNGFQRVLFVDNNGAPLSWATGRRIKPQVAFAAAAATASPKIEGKLRLYYKARPVLTTVYDFTLLLDERNEVQTVEQQQDQLLTEFGSGPILVAEDVDGDSYYIRVESVQVSEVQERGGGSDTHRGAVRVAQVRAVKYPTVAGD